MSNLPLGANYDSKAPFNEIEIVYEVETIIDNTAVSVKGVITTDFFSENNIDKIEECIKEDAKIYIQELFKEVVIGDIEIKNYKKK